MIKNFLRKRELKKFNKLANSSNTVLFTEGNVLNYIYDKTTGKRYFPKYINPTVEY